MFILKSEILEGLWHRSFSQMALQECAPIHFRDIRDKVHLQVRQPVKFSPTGRIRKNLGGDGRSFLLLQNTKTYTYISLEVDTGSGSSSMTRAVEGVETQGCRMARSVGSGTGESSMDVPVLSGVSPVGRADRRSQQCDNSLVR